MSKLRHPSPLAGPARLPRLSPVRPMTGRAGAAAQRGPLRVRLYGEQRPRRVRRLRAARRVRPAAAPHPVATTRTRSTSGSARPGRSSVTPMGNLATVDHAVCKEVLRSRRFGVRARGRSRPAARLRPAPSWTATRPTTPGCAGWSRRRSARRRWPTYRDRIEKTVGEPPRRRPPRPGSSTWCPALAAPLPIAVITDLLGIPDADGDGVRARTARRLGSALAGLRSLRHARRGDGRPTAELTRHLRGALRAAPTRARATT